MSLTRTENGAWTRTPTCYSRRSRRLLLEVPCGVDPPGHFARSGNASHHGLQQGYIGNTFRQNFSLVSLILIFRDFLVHSSFLISCHTKKLTKNQIKMSIPSSYLTTMAWEKFVEKHDAFMRNFKTKVKNEKRRKYSKFFWCIKF